MSALSTLVVARPALAAFGAMGMVWGTFAAILPDLQVQLNVDETRLGLLMFMTPIAAVIAMLFAPRAGAALGRVALPVATLSMACAFAFPGQVTALWLFPVAMMCCGAATGLTDVLMNARVSVLEHDRGLPLMNLCHAAYSFGYAGSAMATGLLREAGWTPTGAMGAMALAGFAMALLTFERDGTIQGLHRPVGQSGSGLGLLPLIGGGIVLIAFMTENAAENWSALHIERTLGGSPAEGAMGPAVLALTMGLARLVGQGLASRIDPVLLLRIGAVVASLGVMIAALALSPAMAYAGFIVMGIGSSVIAPTAFSLVGQLARPQARARAVARATLFGYFGYFFGPPILGFLAGSFGLRAAFLFAAVMLLGVIVLAEGMRRAAIGNHR
jgi:MFS family permease